MSRPSIPMLIVSTILLAAAIACSVSTPVPPSPLPPTLAPTRAAPLGSPPTPLPTLTAPPTPETVITSSEEQLLIDLYERLNPSVVSIIVDVGGEGQGQGSGFVYDTEGHVVTNEHVVAGAQEIEVDFASGLRVRGEVIGTDADSDLAVIKLDAPPDQFVPLPLGDSDQVRVGQRVIAIGNPFRYAGTMTLGIVSGLGRVVPGNRTAPGGGTFSVPDVIQTDAAINPGNSGGPLINLNGEVVGVNRSIASDTGVNSGVGFAVASNTVRQVVPYLIAEGKFVYPYLGIGSLEELSLTLQEQLNLPQAAGAYVTQVVAGGPADQAGIRADSAVEGTGLRGDGDLIVGVDGRPVNVFSDLLSYLVNHTRPGQVVTLTVLREGKSVGVEVTLGERP